MKKIIIASTFAVILSFLFNPMKSNAQFGTVESRIDSAFQIIKYWYVDTVNDKKLYDEAIKGMIKSLDPHSAYIASEEMRAAMEPLQGKFEGVGIQFNIHEDTILVTATIPGGPSEKLGIRAGDRIVIIDNVNVTNIKITNNDVMKKLRGDKGTKVNVKIYRRGIADLIEYVITRDQIPLFTVDASYVIPPNIGYIKISRFADQTDEEFIRALAQLKQKGINSLILDLQSNGGGYLRSAVGLADEFLSDGKKSVYTRGRASSPEDYIATTTGGWEKGKLAVLIDESSASASEIVSGAVQDWDRGLIVGRRSFGKGLVQKHYPLPDGSALRLTVAHYYTPSGRCIQKPYELGDEEEYDLDYSNRLKNGELFHEDSIHFSDSTNYYTNAKRIVKGGGGIMPDIFVPLDTSLSSIYYSDLLRKNVINDFSLTYTDNNRNQLKTSYADVPSFKSGFSITDKIMEDFLRAADKAGVKKDDKGYKISERLIKSHLKALIARNLWDSSAYFEVINDLNNALTKAVQSIKSDTFEKMKLTTN